MARAVYSKRFIGGGLTSGSTLSYTVPSGFVAIVRDFDALLQAVSGQIAYLEAATPGFYLAYFTSTTAATAVQQWRGRQVLVAGEQLVAAAGGSGNVTVAASGYLLTV